MTSSRVTFLSSGFVDVRLHHAEVDYILDMVKSRIRRLCRSEASTPEHFSDISRMARICFVLTSAPLGENVTLTRMSREDVDSLYALPLDHRTPFLLEDLNEVRPVALKTGLVDLDLSDLAAKSVYEVMGS